MVSYICTIWKSMYYNNSWKELNFQYRSQSRKALEFTVLKTQQFQLCMLHLMVFVTLITTRVCSQQVIGRVNTITDNLRTCQKLIVLLANDSEDSLISFLSEKRVYIAKLQLIFQNQSTSITMYLFEYIIMYVCQQLLCYKSQHYMIIKCRVTICSCIYLPLIFARKCAGEQ